MLIDLLWWLDSLSEILANSMKVVLAKGVKKAVIFSTEAPLSSSSKSFIL